MFNVEKRRMENVYSVSSSVKRAKDSIDVEDETPTTSTSLDSLHAKIAQNIESPPKSRTEDTWDSPLVQGRIPAKPTLEELGHTPLDSDGLEATISTTDETSTDMVAMDGLPRNGPPLDGVPMAILPPDGGSPGGHSDPLQSSHIDTDRSLERIQKVSSRLTEKEYRESLMEAYRNISREVSRDPLYPPLPILSKRRGRLEMPRMDDGRDGTHYPLHGARNDVSGGRTNGQNAKHGMCMEGEMDAHNAPYGPMDGPMSSHHYGPSNEHYDDRMEHPDHHSPLRSEHSGHPLNHPRITVNMNEISMERTSGSSVVRIPVTIGDGKTSEHPTMDDTCGPPDGDHDEAPEDRPNGCGHDCLSLPIEDGVLEITSIYDLILDMRFCSLQLPIPNDLTGLREFTLETNESSSITNYDICYDEDLGSNFVMAEPFRFFCKVHITFDKDGEYWCCCYYDARGNYVQKRFNTADIDFNTAQMLANRCRDAAEKTFHSIWILKHKSLLERPIPDGLAESFVHTVNSINECVNNEECIVCCADKIQKILQDR